MAANFKKRSRWNQGIFITASALLGGSIASAADVVQQPFMLLQSTTPTMPMEQTMTPPAPVATASQRYNPQLNQLPEFETTTDICAAGEGYITAHFDFLQGLAGAGGTHQRFFEDEPVQTYVSNGQQYRYELQGQYGITDNIAVGAYIPIVSDSGQDTGTGDVGFYAQYKLDHLVDPKLVNLTGQVDVVLPTGSTDEYRDSGRLGIRPLLLAYKDFGLRGPGVLGAYGLIGFTVQKSSDVRLGVAASYEYEKFVGLLEFTDIDGSGAGGQSLVLFTPAVVYRGLKNLEISVGVPIGMDHSSPDWGVDLKVTYAFAK